MGDVVWFALLTLRQIFRMRWKITVSCRHYQYERVYTGFYIAKLIEEVGEDASIHRLSERSVCSQCGVRRMVFRVERRRDSDDVRKGPPEVARGIRTGERITMCGRYTHNLTWEQIINLYRLTLLAEAPAAVKPNYNVAPTQQLPIVRPHGDGREAVIAGWGLVPRWMKNLERGAFSTINARCETVLTAASYREPFKNQRCIVPTTGWYEWAGKEKRPIHMRHEADPRRRSSFH